MPFVRLLLLLTLALPAVAPAGRAQDLPDGVDPSFPADAVSPVLLLNNPDAVVRLDQRRFDVRNRRKATYRVRRAVTVRTPRGRAEGLLVISYDDLHRLKDLDGRLRDAAGKIVRKLGKGDQEDYSAISGYSLYEENRIRTAELYHDAYPYTVEFEYEIEFDELLNWPAWYPQGLGDDRLPVEHARYEVDFPSDHRLRYKVTGMDQDPEVINRRGRTTWRWDVAVLPAGFTLAAAEDHTGGTDETAGAATDDAPVAVYTAAETFEIEGTAGDMRSWASFGRWYHALTEGRAELPPEAEARVQALVADAPDPLTKIHRLYRHHQTTTRYVSVQLGLGGWQPYDAAYVYTRGYGDCKALVNYLHALLDAAGITSYPALIRNGTSVPDLLADFPSNQFNHVVLMVPMASDTLWLEATRSTFPPGHLGAGNEDRYALAVYPGSGALVRTPRSEAADNRRLRRGHVRLDAAGHATAEVALIYSGNRQDRIRGTLATAPGRERTRWLHDEIEIPSFTVEAADFAGLDVQDASPASLTLPLRLGLARYAARTGSRLFLQPNLLARAPAPPSADRPGPVRLAYAYQDVDSLRYELPEGFALEAIPAPVTLDTAFGRYRAETRLEEDGTLLYYRLFELVDRRIPADAYLAYRDFLLRVGQADRAQVVLVTH